jgi:hypothetical protein
MSQQLIQLTATGNYYESTIDAFATFEGYQELVHLPDGSIPNPQSKKEFICEKIRTVIAEYIARMPIASKVQEIAAEHQNIEEAIKTEILEGITVTSTTI